MPQRQPRPFLVALLLCCSLSGPSLAAEENTAPLDRVAVREKIDALKAQSRKLRAEAQQTAEAEEGKCRQKFLASNCLDAARKQRTEKEKQAKKIENEADTLDRRIKAENRTIRQRQKDEKIQRTEESKAQQNEQAQRKAEKTKQREEQKRKKEQRCDCPCPR